MPAYIYRVRRREPKGGAMAVLPPDPPVVAPVEPIVSDAASETAEAVVAKDLSVATTPKPRRRRRKAAPK